MLFYKYLHDYLENYELDENLLSDSEKSYTKVEIYKLVNKFKNNPFQERLIIGILIDRGTDYLILYIAFLALGITVVPLNKNWTNDYISFVLKESKVNTLIINKEIFAENKFNEYVNLINFEDLFADNFCFAEPKINSNEDSISYIVFTSGTTGLPKGVKISRSSFNEYIKNFPTDKFYKKKGYHLITGEINFDIILADLVIALKNKRKIFIEDNKNIFNIAYSLMRKDIVSAYFVPTFLKSILLIVDGRFDNDLKEKKEIIFYSGGEVLDSKICRKIRENFKLSIIYNNYGPTEVTINCLHCLITDEMIQSERIPTGLPFKSLNYVFDVQNNICKKGMSGQLLVGGAQVMTGYTNLENKKNEKIVNSKEGKIYYKTGDLFEYALDGYFYYLGREDSEIKIHGNRINLESLRNLCLKNLDLEDIVFINISDSLICFVKGINFKESEIKNLLLKSYPKFVLPKKIIKLKKFPLNKNGKLDYANLRLNI